MTTPRHMELVLRDEAGDDAPAVLLPAVVRDALPQVFVESAMPLTVVDDNARLLAVNAGFAALVGSSAGALVGRRLADVVHADDRLGHVASWGSLFGGTARSDRIETRLVREDGRSVPVTVYRHVITDPRGGPPFGLAAIHEETQADDVVERAERVARLARILVESLGDGDAAAETIVTHLADEIGDVAVLWAVHEDGDRLHPLAGWHRDPRRRSAVAEIIASGPRSGHAGLLARVIGLGQPLQLGPDEIDLHRPALHSSYVPYAEEYGLAALLLIPLRSRDRLVGIVGVSRDRGGRGYTSAEADLVMTVAAVAGPVLDGAKRLAALADRDGEPAARAVLDALSIGTAVLDAEGRVVRVNAAWSRTAARSAPFRVDLGVDWVAACAAEVATTSGAADLASGAREILGGERSGYMLDCEREGAWFHVELTALESGGCVVTVTDITQRKRLEMRLAHEATHDPLTGLPNRTLLADRVELALARDRRAGRRTAVVFCDLDHFKSVNDIDGHEVGDRVLIECARRFTGTVRASDTVARIGGDEFVVLIENVTGLDEVLVVADKLVDALRSGRVDETRLPGVSVGVALSDDASTADSLLREADAAMYAAKQAGRSRVQVADGALSPRRDRPTS